MALRDSKEAWNTYQREWKAKNRDSVRISQRKQTLKQRGNQHYLAYYAEYRAKHREKIRARKIFNNAIKYGKIERRPCEVCEVPNAEGHHDDYSKPLSVRWFCKIHHEKHHHEAQRTTNKDRTRHNP